MALLDAIFKFNSDYSISSNIMNINLYMYLSSEIFNMILIDNV